MSLTKADSPHVPNIKRHAWKLPAHFWISSVRSEHTHTTHLHRDFLQTIPPERMKGKVQHLWVRLPKCRDLREFPKQKNSTNQSKLIRHISSKRGSWQYLCFQVGSGLWQRGSQAMLTAGASGAVLGSQLRGWRLLGRGFTDCSAPWYQAEQSEECRRTGSGPKQSCNPTLQISVGKIHIILLLNAIHGIQ